MIIFPISFEFAGLKITASVHKISQTLTASTQYHVYNMIPRLEGIPETWMFIHNPEKEEFNFSISSPNYLNTAASIIEAIRIECEQRQIEYL